MKAQMVGRKCADQRAHTVGVLDVEGAVGHQRAHFRERAGQGRCRLHRQPLVLELRSQADLRSEDVVGRPRIDARTDLLGVLTFEELRDAGGELDVFEAALGFAFGLANGQSIALTDRTVPREVRETVLHSVCTRFTTVLGPGSDGYHEDHIHLDLMERHNNYKICQWNVLDPLPQIAPMLPAERPAEAPPREEAKSETQESDDAKPDDAKPDAAKSGAKPDAPAPAPPTKKRRRTGAF